jgi:hypothetical protein
MDLDSTEPSDNTRPASIPRETAEGCRERAAADITASGELITANQKLRLEASAASWTSRASMLQRVEDGTARRAREAADKTDKEQKF